MSKNIHLSILFYSPSLFLALCLWRYTVGFCLSLNLYILAQIALGFYDMTVRSEEKFSPKHRGIQADTEATIISPHPELNSRGGWGHLEMFQRFNRMSSLFIHTYSTWRSGHEPGYDLRCCSGGLMVDTWLLSAPWQNWSLVSELHHVIFFLWLPQGLVSFLTYH